MKPLEFLAEVLPSPGHGLYCAAELSTTRREHIFVENLNEIKSSVKRWLSKNRNIYFALATFDPKVQGLATRRRTAENAQYVRSLFIDMDGYDSKKGAAMALNAFLQKTGLDEFGTPYVVASGGGLHVYWPLSEDVDIVTWKPIAENFKRLCRQEGLAIDHTVTADAARVLRIPGTLNFKEKYGEPREVRLLVKGDAKVDIRRFGATVRGLLSDKYAPASNSFVIEGVQLEGTRPSNASTKRSALAEAMMGQSKTYFSTIWLKSENGDGCGQITHYREHAHEDGVEPLWRGLLSWTKVCEDGAEYSQKLTELHPYTMERMQAKLNDIRGPYPCVKMDSENPGVCPRCRHWGKVTNALALGREVRTDNREKTFTIPMQGTHDQPVENDPAQYDTTEVIGQEDATPAAVPTSETVRMSPPKGFSYGERDHSGVFIEIKEKDATGVEIKTQAQILNHDLFLVDTLKVDDNDHMAHMMAIRLVGPADGEKSIEYTPILIPMRATASKDETLKYLAAHNVSATIPAYDNHVYAYIRACIAQIKQFKRPLNVPIQFGWQKDRSFVYNNRIFFPDGTECAVPMPGLENLNAATNNKGTVDNWRKPWEYLIEAKLDTLLALAVDSFGSTLMHFSPYAGMTFHAGSTESGTGKSLMLSLKAGVWGHPLFFRTGKNTSPVAMQQRAGLLNSLPLLIDEITTKTRTDTDWVPGMIFDMSEGKGKERMEAGANKERINNTTWSLTCTMNSNTHMTDLLTGARKHSSYGELMRMLEWTPTQRLQFDDDARAKLALIQNNYGVAGTAWIRYCVKNYKLIRDLWNNTHAKLRELLRFTDDERYWHAGVTSIVTAAILLGEQYTGILNVPVQRIIAALKEMVDNARKNFKQAARSAEDVLNTYTRENYGRFVVIRATGTEVAAEMGLDLMHKTSTRNTVMGRIELGVASMHSVDFFVEEQLLKQHCSAMSFGYADFKRQITSQFRVTYERKDMLAKTEGPVMRAKVMHIQIPRDMYDKEFKPVGED